MSSTPPDLIPDTPMMRKQTYASAMSFIGGTRRATAFARRFGTTWWKATLVALGLLIYLPALWLFLVVWYVVVFGLFGVFTFPFRLVRRSHRKQEHLQRQQLATMQALLVNQQQVLQQNQQAAEQDRKIREG